MEILQEKRIKLEEKRKNKFTRAIQFEMFKFSYPNSKMTSFERLNLNFGLEKRLALVGHSEHGKIHHHSINALYPLASGQIQVSDQNIESLSITATDGIWASTPRDLYYSEALFGKHLMENLMQSDEEIIAGCRKKLLMHGYL